MKTENNKFRWASMPSSRKADYYLGYYDDSVFIDFNNFNANQVVLIRISFDGHGCCDVPADKVTPISKDDSAKFKKMFENNDINQDELMKIISTTLLANKTLLWEDALREYQLI